MSADCTGTCGFKVVRSGSSNAVKVEVGTVKIDDLDVISQDMHPKIKSGTVTKQGESEPIYTAPSNSYYLANGFNESITTTVSYGASCVFSISMELEFSAIELESGTVSRTVSVDESFLYMQPLQSNGWGGETAKNLFIPWQE